MTHLAASAPGVRRMITLESITRMVRRAYPEAGAVWVMRDPLGGWVAVWWPPGLPGPVRWDQRTPARVSMSPETWEAHRRLYGVRQMDLALLEDA